MPPPPPSNNTNDEQLSAAIAAHPADVSEQIVDDMSGASGSQFSDSIRSEAASNHPTSTNAEVINEAINQIVNETINEIIDDFSDHISMTSNVDSEMSSLAR